VASHRFKKGHPRYGGRQKGVPPGTSKKLKEIQARDPELVRRLQEFLDQGVKITPLDCMLGVLKLRIEQGDYEGALSAAAQAAPYCHAKLNATDIRVQRTERSDSDITAELVALRAKLDAARALPPPPPTISPTIEHADFQRSSAESAESEDLDIPAPAEAEIPKHAE
jgi:hypothetical protein